MPTKRISVLLVAEPNRSCDEVERLLRHTQWRVHRAHSVAEAYALLKRITFQVVLCERQLSDGSWKSVLKILNDCDSSASIVVLSEADKRTWAEVLNLGGYDLLPLPCRSSELYQIVPAAWRHSRHRAHDQSTAELEGCCR
jgi:DNA-binding NtrC family response regulator